MSFKILNEADDPFPGTPFALPDAVDYDILVAAAAADGVLSGAAVTGSGTTNVAVAAGTALIGGVLVTVAAGNVAVTAGHATLNRLDLIVVDNTGAKSCVAGTPAAGQSVKFPAIPANSVVLAAVWQPAAGTNIAANQVLDKRVVIQPTRPVRDTAANLAAANSVYAAGLLVIATDTHVVSWGDGATAYNSLPKYEEKLDPQRAETTVSDTVASITAEDMPNLSSITFTVGAIPWVVELWVPYVKPTAVGSALITAFFNLTDASNNIKATANVSMPLTVGYGVQARVREYISTAGTYTRKGRWGRSGASSTVQFNLDAADTVTVIEARPYR